MSDLHNSGFHTTEEKDEVQYFLLLAGLYYRRTTLHTEEEELLNKKQKDITYNPIFYLILSICNPLQFIIEN